MSTPARRRAAARRAAVNRAHRLLRLAAGRPEELQRLAREAALDELRKVEEL